MSAEITYNNDKSKTKIDEKDPWFLWKQCQFFTKKIRQAKVNIYHNQNEC